MPGAASAMDLARAGGAKSFGDRSRVVTSSLPTAHAPLVSSDVALRQALSDLVALEPEARADAAMDHIERTSRNHAGCDQDDRDVAAVPCAAYDPLRQRTGDCNGAVADLIASAFPEESWRRTHWWTCTSKN
jgi:hypothetical protein